MPLEIVFSIEKCVLRIVLCLRPIDQNRDICLTSKCDSFSDLHYIIDEETPRKVEVGERNYNMVGIKHADFTNICIVISPLALQNHTTRVLIDNISSDIIQDDPREKKSALCMARLSGGADSIYKHFFLLCVRLTNSNQF